MMNNSTAIAELKAEIELAEETLMTADSPSERHYAGIRLDQLEAMLADLETTDD